jgi:hypothetical protein
LRGLLGLAALTGCPRSAPETGSGPPDDCQGGDICSGSCVDTTSDAQHCGRCDHACLGGACDGSKCAPVELYAWSGVRAPLVPDGDLLYFGMNAGGGAILRGPKLPAKDELAEALGGWNGYTLALARDAQSLYWTDLNPGEVFRWPIGPATEPASVVTTAKYALSVAVSGRKLFTGTSDKVVGTGTIAAMDLDSDVVTTLSTGHEWPVEMTATEGAVYFLDQHTSAAPILSDVVRTFTDGSGFELLAEGVAGAASLVLHRDILYFTSNHAVMRVVLGAGGAPAAPEPAVGDVLFPFDVAVDDAGIYWADPNGVWTVPLEGGPRVRLYAGNVTRIAVDEAAVYWTDQEKTAVMKLAK